MSIGFRSLQIGPHMGATIGQFGAANPMASVTRDATSGIYCPATSSEWTTTLSAAGDAVGGPSALYLCQEASGNLADSIGTFTLTASGTGLTYAQAVSGWARKGVSSNDGGTGVFTSTDAGLPDLSATSFAALAYFSATTPAANRTFAGMGTTTTTLGLVQSTGVGRCLSGANSSVGAQVATGQVRPWVLMHNKTASADQLYNDMEKITPTFSATTTGKQFQFGSAAHAPGSLVYLALFFGAAAERTSTQWKTLLTTLSWSPAFS